MYFELDSGDFARARDAFLPMSHNLAVDSIIRSLTPGRIYVDDPEEPSSALTWFKGRVFLSGDSEDRTFSYGVSEILSGSYRDMVVRRGGRGFALYYHPVGWGARLGEMLPNASRTTYRRLYYRLDASERSWDVSPPEGYTLLPIDSELLERADLEDIDGVVDEMKSERSTVEAFLEKSFGYCVVHDCAIVGWCMSEYNAGDRCELGIATEEGHRRRGLATLTGRAVIHKAVSRGITDIGWHCYASNTPSVATAEKLGFARAMEYPVIWVNFS